MHPMRTTLMLFPLVVCFFVFTNLSSQTVLKFSVTDIKKESLIGATIKVMKDTNIIRGTLTDFDGKGSLQLDPGTYDIEVSYTGYQTNRINGVQVLAGKINELNIEMYDNNVLNVETNTGFKVPLIERDKTKVSSGQRLTPEQIKNLPTRYVNGIIASTAGSSSTDGGTISIKGARSNATNYYIDGVRVTGAPPPVQDLNPLSGVTGGLGVTATPPQPSPVSLEKRPKNEDLKGQIIADTLIPESTWEQYHGIVENPFQDAHLSNISTFSIDVDRAAYSNVRRFLMGGQSPPADAVRIEEMVNYFDYQYQKPTGQHPFEVNTEVADCPWAPNHKLLVVGLQGAEMDLGQLPHSNLVFLVDVSGSMEAPNKLPLLIQSLELLTDQLRPNDQVAIVVYAGAAGLVLESTPGSDKIKIKEALERLRAGGSTAGAAGIQLAYQTAQKNFIPKGNNRVILCTDGDFNVGVSSDTQLETLIENERKSGVYLTVLGFGMGNYQDGKMQMLADKGNGNHAYIDQLSEAQKVLGTEFGGTLFTIAKDVKLQLHFNPKIVAGYRLIGYENRLLATEDFNNDAKDAGELGAGHRVTALYELIPAGEAIPALTTLDSALVVVQAPDKSVKIKNNDLMVLQLRYKKPDGEQSSKLMEYRLNAGAINKTQRSENFMLASAVAEFGLLLRNSKFKGQSSYEAAIKRATLTLNNDPHGYRAELVRLMEMATKVR